VNKIIKNILNTYQDKNAKLEELNKLREDIDLAEKVLSDSWTYCKDCDDYYLTESFKNKFKTERKKICIYNSPINSGDDDYADGEVGTLYRMCPKGHETIINEIEKRI
jgi:hypothetical protein